VEESLKVLQSLHRRKGTVFIFRSTEARTIACVMHLGHCITLRQRIALRARALHTASDMQTSGVTQHYTTSI
jgi:hypothetical protein